MYIKNERKEQKSKRADPNQADILHHSRYYKRDVFIGRLIDRRLLVIYNLKKGFINNNGSECIINIYIYLLSVYKYNNIMMTSVYTTIIFEGKLAVIPEKEGCYWKLSRYKKKHKRLVAITYIYIHNIVRNYYRYCYYYY